MSLVSDLAAVLRRPDQHTAQAPAQPEEALTKSQCVPLHQQSTAEPEGLSAGVVSASKPPNEPLTPDAASPPKPSSWPNPYPAAPQSSVEASQEQHLQCSSLQPTELSQPPPRHLAQSASDCNSNSVVSSSSSKGDSPASQIPVSNESSPDVAVPSKHSEASSARQPDSLQFVPPECATASSTDDSEAPSAKPAPKRCILRATLRVLLYMHRKSRITQEQHHALCDVQTRWSYVFTIMWSKSLQAGVHSKHASLQALRF